MNDRRELIFGLLAALVSLFIVGGSFIISNIEKKPELALASSSTPYPTEKKSPTVIIQTPQPGEPTLTPSATIPEVTPTIPILTPSCQFPDDWLMITINQGDTLESLARTYRTTPEALIEANCLFIDRLTPGSQFYVPKPISSLTPTQTTTPRPTATTCPGPPSGWVIYIVQPGDTLYALSLIYDVTVAQLQAANCMGTSDVIRVGSKLWVPYIPTKTPTSSPTYTPSPTGINPPPAITDAPTLTSTPTSTSTATSTATATNTPTGTSTATSIPTAADTTAP